MGSAKVKIGEALASNDPERRKSRLLDAMAEMNEAETTHLSEDYPEMSRKIRGLRKEVEEEAFGFSKHNIGPGSLTPIVNELLELEKRDRDKPKKEEEENYVPDEAFGKVLPATPENVLKAVDHYKGDYGAPASLSDIQFLLSIPHKSALDKQIDRAFSRVPMPTIERSVRDLLGKGLIENTPEGGYLATESGREHLGFTGPAQGFNIPEGYNRVKMLKGSDVGLIVGSELAGKGTTILASWVDTQYGLSTQPLHLRASTYIPLIGAAAVLASRYVKAFKKKEETQVATAVFGAYLLAQGVDVVQQATTPGVSLGLVAVPRAVVQPGMTAAPMPGYLRSDLGGVGGLRDIF